MIDMKCSLEISVYFKYISSTGMDCLLKRMSVFDIWIE